MSTFQAKIQKLGKEMPLYMEKSGPQKARPIIEGIQEIKDPLKAKKIKEAEAVADRLPNSIGN